MKITISTLIFIMGLLMMFFSCVQEKSGSPIRLTALNSMQRMLPVNPVRGDPTVEIKAARNEYEAFQVVITAGNQNNLRNVRIHVSDLVNGSETISKSNMEIFRTHDVYLPHSSPRAELPPGLYPDPLMPFINPVTGDSIRANRKLEAPEGDPLRIPRHSAYPIEIYPNQHCILWVDLYIPSQTKAGVYKGTLDVYAEDGISASMPISLTVWDFTLPDVAAHRTHLGHFSLISKVWDIEPESDQYRNTEIAYCEELARHRVNPPIPHSLLPEVNEDGSIIIDPDRHQQLADYVERTHLVDFEVPRTPFMTNTSNSDRPTPENQTDPVAIEKSKRYYSEMYQYIKENGWEKRAYLYMQDEPNSVKDYNQVINLGKVVKDAAPELQVLVVEQTYKHDPSWPDIDPYIDIWCPLFGFIDRNTIHEKIDKGDEVWSYTALVQPAPPYHPDYENLQGKNPPYWHIDQPVIMYRIPTWLNRQYDIQGLLYWTTSGWYNDISPWMFPTLGPWESGSPDSTEYDTRYFNGGGILFYPGLEAGFDGPVSSIRLKNIREGLEDFEYFAILDRNGESEFVQEMVDQVCPEWWDFAKDPDQLLKVRERLAQKIESLNLN
ncbi:MAG: DUF4091 domain-containing protein [Cyclobacteriaceae bacterium]|nr:DUF4091 domain-containing protein [Cyclobacteriaceae bacterium]